jgi:hypothetical protein
MNIDLSARDAMPDYGKEIYLRDDFNFSLGVEVQTHDSTAVMSESALLEWRQYVRNWFNLHKGNKNVTPVCLYTWVLNNPQHSIKIQRKPSSVIQSFPKLAVSFVVHVVVLYPPFQGGIIYLS